MGLFDRIPLDRILPQRAPSYVQSAAERRARRDEERAELLAHIEQQERTEQQQGQAGQQERYAREMFIAQGAQRLSARCDPRSASYDVSGGQHPIQQITQRAFASGALHETQLLVFHLMRQYAPTLDAAIRNRRVLEGDAYVVSKDESLAADLNAFIEAAPVGYLAGAAQLRGVNTYANLLAENADEYGLGAGEIVMEERGRAIERLVVPNARTLSLRKTPGTAPASDLRELWQAAAGTGARRIDDSPFVQVLAFSASSESPWPYPLAWSLIKSTEALLRMYEAVINGWWRFGDPSLLLGFEYDAKAIEAAGGLDTETTTVDGEAQEIPPGVILFKDTVEAVMNDRRKGMVGDAYVYVTGGKIKNEVLGDVDQTLMRYFKEQSGLFDGHIIGASDTPAWMYPHAEARGDGLGSARSNNQALIAAVGARKRNWAKARIIRGVLDAHLVASGAARYVGKYELEFETANILDDKVEAEARKVAAEAEAAEIENAVQLFDETGRRRFAGEAEEYLKDRGILK